MHKMIKPRRQPVSTEGSAAIDTTMNSARRGGQPRALAQSYTRLRRLWSGAARRPLS
jgi:hypothetical protein